MDNVSTIRRVVLPRAVMEKALKLLGIPVTETYVHEEARDSHGNLIWDVTNRLKE